MNRPIALLFVASLVVTIPSAGSVRAGSRETATVESATAVLEELSAIPLKCIPPSLLQDAQGVAVIPDVIKAGFVLGGRHGRGVLLVRQPDGWWGNPIFVSITGGSIGWQIGVQSTDVVLVFKTRNGLDRIMKGKGKLTLGADVGVAAGPVGRQAEAGTDGQLKSEIFSYSRSRGLFAGVSLEGAGLLIEHDANDAFYRVPNLKVEQIVTLRGVAAPEVERLKAQLLRMSVATAEPAVVPMQPLVPIPISPLPTVPPIAPPMPVPPPPPPVQQPR